MSVARHLPGAARVLLGLVFFVFGLNGFLQFLPQPPITGAPLAFVSALMASGYVIPIVKGTEVIAGLMLLGNRFVPLALALLAPIVVAIVGYHLALEPTGTPLGIIVLALELFLAFTYRDAFAPMLKARVAPAVPEASLHLAPHAS